MNMITGVCLNPAIDKVIEIDKFSYGETNRALQTSEALGGKAINVIKALKLAGNDGAISGFCYQQNKNRYDAFINEYQLKSFVCNVPGAMRTNLKIFDKENKVITEINENGREISPKEFDCFLTEYKERLKQTKIVVLSGSIPKGIGIGVYYQLADLAKREQIDVIIDASGESLLQALKAKPKLIKPNIEELEKTVGRKLNGIDEIKAAAINFVEQGAEIVLVSLGKDGAMITNGENTYYAEGRKVDVVNTVGAGDSMVAGAINKLLKTADIKQILKMGVAYATISVTQQGPGLCSLTGITDLYEDIKVTSI